MHSVLALVTTFVNTSGLMIMMGIDFLGLLFLIVYVGAIAILFLFVVMMLNIKLVEIIDNTTRYAPLGLIIGIILALELNYVINISVKGEQSISGFNQPVYVDFSELLYGNKETIISIGQVIYTEYWLYFIIASIILLVSMVGAIVLTLKHEENVKRQDIYTQITR